MKQFIVTFGFAHKDTQGNELKNCYTIIRAKTENEAREKMFKSKLGHQWAFMYKSKDEAGVEKYNLRYVKFASL